MKSPFLIVFFLLIALSTAVLGVELKGDFTVSGEVASVKEGDLVEATLKVWPVENADANEFQKLQNALLFNVFQLVQLQSIEPSANNADVVEVKGTYIVRATKGLSSFMLNYKGQSVTVAPPQVKIVPLEKKAEDYFVLDQSLSLSQYQFIIVLIVLLGLAVFAIIKREKLLSSIKRLRKDPRAQSMKFYNEKFLSASTREDYEAIYAKKSEWLSLLQEQPMATNEFFKLMNQHQYKKSWSNEDLQEVKNIFDIIRGSFK